MICGATFSPDRRHRYALWREWEADVGAAMFIGLNPSTADEKQDDPTVRRCIAYARAWGCGSLWMTNIFAFRATDPRVMKACKDPIGVRNNSELRARARAAKLVVAAWGVHGEHMGRGEEVRRMLGEHCDLRVLKLTKGGHPAHPLYLKANLLPLLWRGFERDGG